MSSFLNDVRVIPLFAQTPASPAKPEDAAGVTITESNGRTIHVNKHSSSDNDGIYAAIPITAIVFFFIYKIVKAIMAPFGRDRHTLPSQQGGGLTQEEVAVLHKLQRTLSQMESRVEALETILIEQSRTEKKYGSKL